MFASNGAGNPLLLFLYLIRGNSAVAEVRKSKLSNSQDGQSPTQKDALSGEEHPQRYTSTGIFECVSTLTVSLPSTTAETPRCPCEAITIKSHFLAVAASMIA
jgi:hypothetical protein